MNMTDEIILDDEKFWDAKGQDKKKNSAPQ
jgi:hypothetical protein